MEKEEVSLPLGYNHQSSRKMDKEEVSLPPPPLPPFGYGRYQTRNHKKMDKEEVSPPPPPLPLFGYGRYQTRNHKKMDKEKVPPPPSPHPPLHSLPSSKPEVKPHPRPTKNPICPVSHPSQPHTLSLRSGRNTKFDCFSCRKHMSPLTYHNYHYYCKTCDMEFHHGCHTFPRKLTHPYHLQHPLTFTFRNNETGFLSDGNIDVSFSTTLSSYSNLPGSNKSDHNKFESTESDQCTWCGKYIQGNWFYHCPICNFCLDLSCSQQSVPLLLVAKPKSHHHPLVFYTRPLLTPCDACGLVNVLEPSYACFQCNYMVHQSCIDLPRVIKITRHEHRLHHTPYLRSTISPCRICYQPVDIKYGQYYCNRENCSYVVHSKCATHENIWDRKELEWEPEESDEIEDIMPFKKFGSDMIKHFSHDHLLKLETYDGARDAEKQCQACILPINSHDFYNCMECDFFLHEVCACLLRKLNHALHKHTLILDTSPQNHYDLINCSVCSRKSTGFMYRCSETDCRLLKDQVLQIDVRCILVLDYFTHESHEHPLFICTSSKGENKICCEGCKEICQQPYLQCTTCKFAMCYQCTTVPTEVCYKYDKHPLSLCYGEQADDMYWCEICEKEVNPADWFYTCNICCITIHLHCIFGNSVYMKPGLTFEYGFTSKVEVLRNSNSTRPLCVRCGNHCPGYSYYCHIGSYGQWTLKSVTCSLKCLEPYLY